jgi:hypothetical protein
VKSLAGTRWATRVILGCKGAAAQRTFAGTIGGTSARHTIICDDTLLELKAASGTAAPGKLEDVFEKAGEMMAEREGKASEMTIWGFNQAQRFLHTFAEDATSKSNSLIYGALFGFRSDANHVTEFGDVRGDVETSLNHYDKGGICRFMGYHARKHGAPGAFKPGGGGISNFHDAESHAKEREAALVSLIGKYPKLVARKKGIFDVQFKKGRRAKMETPAEMETPTKREKPTKRAKRANRHSASSPGSNSLSSASSSDAK